MVDLSGSEGIETIRLGSLTPVRIMQLRLATSQRRLELPISGHLFFHGRSKIVGLDCKLTVC